MTTKKEVSHTPGPWRVTEEDGDRELLAANGESLMCDLQYYPWTPASDADWRLIAAAPELLEALTMIHRVMIQRNMMDDEREVVDQAWAAISKATGKVAAGAR